MNGFGVGKSSETLPLLTRMDFGGLWASLNHHILID